MTFTRDTVSWTDIVGLRDGAEDIGDAATVQTCNRALDQYIEYRDYTNPEHSCDVDALDDVCRRLNDADTVIASAFEAVRPVITQLEADVAARDADTYAERRDWARWLTQYKALAKGMI